MNAEVEEFDVEKYQAEHKQPSEAAPGAVARR